MRLHYDWNDGWEYSRAEEGAPWVGVRLPHTNVELPYNDFSEKLYQFESRYRKAFTPDPSLRGKRGWLTFEGAMARARVFLNGEPLAEHRGGYTSFRVALGDGLRFGGENLLTVELDSREDPEIPPFGHVVDYLTYGGLYREASLEWVNPVAIGSLFVRAGWEDGKPRAFAFDAAIDNGESYRGEARLNWEIAGEDGPIARGEETAVLDGTALQVLTVSGEAPAALPWEPENPRLYVLRVSLAREGEVLDEDSARFGFRRTEFKPDGFYLNGKKMKLRGLNRHQAFPYAGYAMPRSAQRRDAEILKEELGVNVVRSSHYPPSRHFLDRCDEIGLLAFVETPGWQHIGGDAWKKVVLQNVEEMVRQEWNHPSVIMWGVRINESQDDDELYRATNALARSLDPTRPTGGVRNFGGSRLFEDVYTFNDFTHSGGPAVLAKPARISGGKVPHLVTEFNGHMFPTKRFDPEARRTEHALRHLRVLDRMSGDPGIAGAIGWCFADYNTHKDFGSGDRICYHGVSDMFRLPKAAAGAYASQREDKPYLELASAMTPGDHDAANQPPLVILTNADWVDLFLNGEKIGRHFPDRNAYPHLAHPPIVVSDFIGDRLERNEGFSAKDAERVKSVFRAIMKWGENRLPLKYLATMGLLLLKYRMSHGDATRLFGAYVVNWGEKLQVWEVRAWKDGKPALTARTGPHESDRLEVKPDSLELVEGASWDCVRVVLRHLDENGRTLPYSNEALRVTLEGPGEIIGPDTFSLVGGARAFWVRTTGKAGTVRVKVESSRFGTQALELKVRLEKP